MLSDTVCYPFMTNIGCDLCLYTKHPAREVQVRAITNLFIVVININFYYCECIFFTEQYFYKYVSEFI